MSENINVTLLDNIAKYLQRKSKNEYLPISAVARQYIAKGVIEEMVVNYHQKGYSITKLKIYCLTFLQLVCRWIKS